MGMAFSTSADAALALADEIMEYGPRALVVQADVTDYEQVSRMIQQAMD